MFKREAQTPEQQLDTEQQAEQPRSSSQRAYGKSPAAGTIEETKQENIRAADELDKAAPVITPPMIKPPCDGKTATPQSILDLPDEVKKNMVGYEDMELDELLLRILATHTAATSADRIIMLLYTTYQKQPPRVKVLARLRSMEKAGMVKKAAGRSMYSKAAIS